MQVQESFNPIFDYFVEAFDQAKTLDEQYKENPQKPPLFGIPFSVKNYFYVRLMFPYGAPP